MSSFVAALLQRSCVNQRHPLQVCSVVSTNTFLEDKAIWAFQNMSAAVDALSVPSNRSLHHLWGARRTQSPMFGFRSFNAADLIWNLKERGYVA